MVKVKRPKIGLSSAMRTFGSFFQEKRRKKREREERRKEARKRRKALAKENSLKHSLTSQFEDKDVELLKNAVVEEKDHISVKQKKKQISVVWNTENEPVERKKKRVFRKSSSIRLIYTPMGNKR